MVVNFLLKLDFLAYTVRYIILIALWKLKYLRRGCWYSDYHTGEKVINLLDFKNYSMAMREQAFKFE